MKPGRFNRAVETHDNIEVRDYDPMIVAEAEVSGPRDKPISEEFRIIANYIFGNNSTSQKVSMTAPAPCKKAKRSR